jgi:hypothetical protein
LKGGVIGMDTDPGDLVQVIVEVLALILTAAALAVAIGTWIWPDIRFLLFSSATPMPTSGPSFDYQVRVQAKDTGEYVQGAKVTIEVGGKAPLDDITDSSGLARIFVPSSHVDHPGVLRVEATGYERYKQHIDLTKDTLPDIVRLEPAP